MVVSQFVGAHSKRRSTRRASRLMIVGLEVPHVHLHVVPTHQMGDVNFANAAKSTDPGDLESAAEEIRTELRAQGHAEASA